MNVLGPALAIIVVTLVIVGYTADAVRGPVTRRRVDRFAIRQKLSITPANGNHVIAYLATTRRWRAAGLAGGFMLSILWSAHPERWSTTHPERTVKALMLFAGWFTGALIAEVRVAHLALGVRRAASLEPRRASAYLSRLARLPLPAAIGASVAIAATTAALAVSHQVQAGWTAIAWLAASVAVAAAVYVTEAHVLRRPQPVAEPDVLAADDAIRSRSLRVLAAGGTALVLYCCVAQLGALHLDSASLAAPIVGGATVVGVVLIPILGWRMANTPWRVRRLDQIDDARLK